jgi:uracil-DNA glycosylase
MTTEVEALTWQTLLRQEKQKPYFKDILHFLAQREAQDKQIYPPRELIFNALKTTPFLDTKVVIIGQDPYHGPNQAMGLSFSVPKGVKPPPSLKNIYKEIKADLDLPQPSHGCLTHWALQGVLLLNATLTVEAHQPQSHANIGWQQFTDTVISALNHHPKPVIFLLWGAYAQKKAALINNPNHMILKATHPSPLSAHRGFLGCKHFSKTNQWLAQVGRTPIDWYIPE